MRAPRPCLGPVDRQARCPNYALPGKDRCEIHHEPRKPTPSGRVTQTSRWRRLRREFIAAQPRPLVCAIGNHVITDESLVEIDHVQEIAAGGDPWNPANWQVACRPHNRRKKARPKHRNPTNRNVPPWMLND